LGNPASDFDTISDDADDPEDGRESPYVLIGRNSEFPGVATIEWHDGTDYDGSARIRSAHLKDDQIMIVLDKSRTIAITFDLDTIHLEELQKYLQNTLGSRLTIE
jgi:hypothetical protein